MRSMLSICDRFANDFDVTFNGNKSKCIMFKACNHYAVHDNIATVPHFLLRCHANDCILTWPHLVHIFSANLLDNGDILAQSNRFVGQTNNLLCNFSKIDVSVRNRLFKSYCSSHCGAELWDLTNRKIEDYCVAWWKGLRNGILQLPYDASRLNVAFISDTVPLLSKLCRRVTNFIYTCLHCDTDFVRSTVAYGNAAGTRSLNGRNAAFVHCVMASI
jgi:hypothetical protein